MEESDIWLKNCLSFCNINAKLKFLFGKPSVNLLSIHMCGINGIYSFNEAGRFNSINHAQATASLQHRGPDDQGQYIREHISLGHRRLSIIDLSEHGHQPMSDATDQYVIVFNGEIYNYQSLKKDLENRGHRFHSQTDTEVLLNSYIAWGSGCLSKLNGFFAFAIYDKSAKNLFLARDRYGIKPLYYFYDEDKFIFGSELQAILAYGIDKQLDNTALFSYLQLNYLPAPFTMVEGVMSLLPGHYIEVAKKKVQLKAYYDIEEKARYTKQIDYRSARDQIGSLLEQSVCDRLVADVPLGTFLSGGIDSSIITGIAAKHKENIDSFSIGYADEPFFFFFCYAKEVAEHFGTRHTVFSLNNSDLEQHLDQILNHFDQPFADSSAIPTYLLSKLTRQHVKVALSGDGADELFSGYHKHEAFRRSMSSGWMNGVLPFTSVLWQNLPASRNNAFSNKIRQLRKYSEGLKLSLPERYWRWASITDPETVQHWMEVSHNEGIEWKAYDAMRANYLNGLTEKDMNRVLLADMKLVLPNDMLKKVDHMSMAHGLEVRVPFLDHRLVEFVQSLPAEYKINENMRKRILQDTYREFLPETLYNRPKKGFEVPLLKWFRGSLKSLICDDLLQDKFIAEQGVFVPSEIKLLKKQLFSRNPGDVHAQIWALLVFQRWWKRFMQ